MIEKDTFTCKNVEKKFIFEIYNALVADNYIVPFVVIL